MEYQGSFERHRGSVTRRNSLLPLAVCTLLLLVFAVNGYSACSWSTNVGTAASCTTTEIGYCLTDASSKSGEIIVQLPACSVSWSGAVSVNMKTGFANVTKLTIKGSGNPPAVGSSNETVLANGGFTLTTKTTKKIQVSNITFTGTGTASGNFFWITGDTKPSLGGGFRIDHMSFNGGHAIQGYAGDAYGVIDSNNGGTKGQFSGWIWGTDHYLGGGNGSWTSVSTVGGQDNVFFENNVLVQTDTAKKWMLCDGVNGARLVARYNTLTDYYISGHDASSVDRGIFSYEAYNNIFIATGSGMNAPLSMRGGTGHFFNNVIQAQKSGPFYTGEGDGISLYNYRSYSPSIGSVSPWTTACDATAEKGCVSGSVFLSKTCSSDADCEGVAGSCQQLDGNTDGTGYPCRDQWGRGTNQTLAPTLFWNNTLSIAGGTPVLVTPYVASVFSKHIKSGRDYCVTDGSCSGMSCKYTCGTVLVDYKAFDYPHPLRDDLPTPTMYQPVGTK